MFSRGLFDMLDAAGLHWEIIPPEGGWLSAEAIGHFDALFIGTSKVDEQALHADTGRLRLVARNGVRHRRLRWYRQRDRAYRGFARRPHCCQRPVPDTGETLGSGVTLLSLDGLLRQTGVVVIACNLDKATFHLIDAERLSLRKREAFPVNVARGPIVDEAALVSALQRGEIAGAGIDAFEHEPPDPANPLFHMDNVIMPPH